MTVLLEYLSISVLSIVYIYVCVLLKYFNRALMDFNYHLSEHL